MTNGHRGKVRGAQLCKTSKAGAASVSKVPGKAAPAPGQEEYIELDFKRADSLINTELNKKEIGRTFLRLLIQ